MTFTTLVTSEQLHARLADPNLVIVDCRFQLADPDAGRRAYLAAHIPGAVYAHLDRDLSGPKTGHNGRHPLPTPEAMRATFGARGIGPGAQVIAYDDTGGGIGAARLWWLLRYMSHKTVAVLDGGWQDWQAARYDTRSGEENRIAATFTGRPRPEMAVGASSLISPAWTLIDSRTAARYRGDEEPLDPVAGRIPGARNHDWANTLVAPNGRMLPPEQLRAAFLGLLSGAPPEQAVFYCGSGVSAAHNVLAMEVAGLPGAKLYPGSWSEWCSDPARPIATGE